MPTTPRSLKGTVAVSRDNLSITPLGYLTWFSVPDEPVALRTLRNRWGMAGLPVDVLPTDTRAIDVFKRACRSVEGRRKNGIITDTLVEQVDDNAHDCIYQLTRQVRDLNERIVDHPKAGRVIFNKITEEITKHEPLGGVDKRDVMDMFDAIDEFYEQNTTRVTGAKVRTLVRNYLRNVPDEPNGIWGLGGENLRGKAGGIYFVPQRHLDKLEALSDCLDQLYKGGKAYLHFVPLADSASERAIVRAHTIGNAKAEYQATVEEIQGILREADAGERKQTVRKDRVKNLWAKAERLRRHMSDYQDILADEADEMTWLDDTLRKQLRKLPDIDD